MTGKRKSIVLSSLNLSGKGLEIGASHNPLAPKSEGHNVEIMDHLDQAGLKAKYADDPNVCVDNIEVVDYVWSGERYADLTGKQEYYDWVIASHVIEHVPDLVSFLQGCAEILADDGVLALVVPDFRNCFDHLRVPTSLAKVLDAYHNKNTRPTSGDVLEANLNASTIAGKITWSSKNKGKCEFVLEDGAAKELYARSLSSSDYIDVHTWCFTPNSFRLLIHDLAMLELIPFQVVDVVRTRSFEFFVPLKKTRVLQSVDRMALLEACQQDLYEPGVNGKNLLKKWFSRAR